MEEKDGKNVNPDKGSKFNIEHMDDVPFSDMLRYLPTKV